MRTFIILLLALAVSSGVLREQSFAQDQTKEQEQLKSQDEPGSRAKLPGTRQGSKWRIPIADSGPTRIPRVCASLRSAYFEGMPDKQVNVHPEIEYWEVRFKGESLAKYVILEFDSFPATLDETKPTEQAGDGTLTLRCSQGRTAGQKLRFEPQPHKNTIGYWAEAADSVFWPIKISRPGPFNVGVLQGAGKQGGGIARISLLANNGNIVDSLEFRVERTGHFQNFIWKHAGSLTAMEAGDYTLKIEAKKIDDIALMDVRQVHLSPKR